ncbi:MAG TPA: hypothetical protein VN083_08585, partial [Vicinamibacteria bacterium]|nr:hypothetical protein [Vicinamibacteria bacterium]
LALVLQPRTPLAVALSLLSSLLRADLRRVMDTPGLAPLVRIAAERLGASSPPTAGDPDPPR